MKAHPCHAQDHYISVSFQALLHPYQGKVPYYKAVKQLFQKKRYIEKIKA